MRQTFNISLPEDMSYFVRERIEQMDFTTVSEYFRHLVRLDRDRYTGGIGSRGDVPPLRSFGSSRDPATGRWR